MADIRIALTDRNIARLPAATEGQYVARDTDLKGFYLLVGKKRRRFMVQGDLRHEGKRATTIKVSVGDADELTAQKARGIAKGYLSEISKGRHPKPEAVRAQTIVAQAIATAEDAGEAPSQPITLRVAWERYLETHLVRKNRSEGTIAGYRDHVERVLKEWLDKPLKDLADDADQVARKHDALTKESGPYGANGAMRTLRAIYNHARKKNKKALPADNPVDAVDWNPEERRNTAMGVKELIGWFEELVAIENPIRREFHLFTLLSGSRPTAIKTARPEHIDWMRRVLHIPTPKGGSKRAFDIPLSRQMIACLVRAMRYSRAMHPLEAHSWIFAAGSNSGHLEEHKEDRGLDGESNASASQKAVLSKWGNDLRQTFRTLATVAKVSEVDAKLLMNHAIPGVNGGYITREKIVEDHLRSQQQAISGVVFGPIREHVGKPGPLRDWLGPRATRRAIDNAASRFAKEGKKETEPMRKAA